MPRNTYVSSSEGARTIGVSVDTLRRWDDSGALKSTIRTTGGQRRFLLEELEAVRDGEMTHHDDVASSVAPPIPEAPKPRVVHPWEAREAEAKADVNVTRARIERREEVRRYREAEAAREARMRAEAETRAAEARGRHAANARLERDQRELERHLSFLRMGFAFEPAAAKAEIEKFLSDQARPGVSGQWIDATVAAIRERHAQEQRARDKREALERDEQERLAQAARNEKVQRDLQELETSRHRDALIAHGERIAARDTTTSDWDDDIGVEARAVVRSELEAEVSADWSERDVEELVQEVLEEWEPW